MSIKINYLDNSVDYYASDIVRQFKSLVQVNGVGSTTDFYVEPTTPTSLAVNVRAGSAWIDGYFITMDEDIEIEIPLNTGTTAVNKIYLVLDTSNKSANVLIDSGETETGKLKLKLANVKMENTNTVVEPSQISDRVGNVSHATQEDINEIWTTVSQMISGGKGVAYADTAGYATSAGSATTATSATSATTATSATSATT